MFESDICRCGNADLCPHKDNCRRAEKIKVIGIYTISNFYKDKEKCEYFWAITKNKKEVNNNA